MRALRTFTPLDKQSAFVGAVLFVGFLAFALAAGFGADYWEPLVGLAAAAVLALAVVGLFTVAGWMFPDEEDRP